MGGKEWVLVCRRTVTSGGIIILCPSWNSAEARTSRNRLQCPCGTRGVPAIVSATKQSHSFLQTQNKRSTGKIGFHIREARDDDTYTPNVAQTLCLESRLELYRMHDASVQSGIGPGLWPHDRVDVDGQDASSCILAFHRRWRRRCVRAHVCDEERVVPRARS